MDKDTQQKDILIENGIIAMPAVAFMQMEQPWTLQNGETIHGLSEQATGQWYGDL